MKGGAPAARWRHFVTGLRQAVGSGRGARPVGWSGPLPGRLAIIFALTMLAAWLARAPLRQAAVSLAGAALFLATFAEPAFGLAALALAIPFGSLLPLPLPGADIVDALAGLVVAAWLARGLARRRITLQVPRLGWAMLALAWVLALSLTQAASWRQGLPEWLKWGEFVAVYLAAVEIFGPDGGQGSATARKVWAAGGLLFAGLLEVGLGAYQFLYQAGPEPFIILERFMRAYGTFAQPNPYAGYLGYLAPVAVSLALAGIPASLALLRRRAFDRQTLLVALACGLAALLLVAGIVMSWSRGSWLGLAVAMVAVVGLRNRRAAPAVAAVMVVVAAAWLALGTSWLPAPVARRLSDLDLYSANVDLGGVEVNDDNYAVLERLGHWQAGMDMFAGHPWLGVGVGNYAVAYEAYARPHFYEPLGHAHNVYINFLAEAGVFGGIAFGLFWVAALVTAWQAARRSTGLAMALAVGVLGSLVYVTVHNLFDNLFVAHMQLQLAILLALITPRRGD